MYVFNKRKMTELRVGNAILKEFVERDNQAAERAANAKATEKAAREAAAQKVTALLSRAISTDRLVII